MKNILIILTLLTIFGCRKTETFTLHGNVKHKFTNANIPGIYMIITGPGQLTTSSGVTYADAYTDNDGNYVANFDLKVYKNHSWTFTIWAVYPDGNNDSTKNNFKYYYDSYEINESESDNAHDFLLRPSGFISLFASDSTWSSINADSILIQSPFESKHLVRYVTPDNQIFFDVDPSTESTFSWCYIKNGIQSALVTKNIFVPNCNVPGPQFKYELIF